MNLKALEPQFPVPAAHIPVTQLPQQLSVVDRRKIEELSAQANQQIPNQNFPLPLDKWLPQHAAHQVTSISDLRPRLATVEKFKVSDIDEAVHFLLCHFIDKGNDHLLTKEEIYVQMKDLMKKYEEKATIASGKESSYKFTDKITSILQKAVESFGLIISGIIAALTMGNIPMGVAAVAIGSLMLVETIFDNPVKKQIAAILKKMTGETDELWLQRVHYFTSAIAIAVGFGCGAQQAIEIAKHVSLAALAAVQAVTSTKANSAKKEYLEHDYLVEMVKNLLHKVTDGVKSDTDRLRMFLQLATSIQKSRSDTTSALLKA